jgi:hypothetical protein
MLFLMNK